ncbi:MAG: transposase [Ruminococcus sp.]|nr:transposase [Ruminococcus sp.]
MKNFFDSMIKPVVNPNFSYSFSGKLEAIIGKYFVSGEGVPGKSIYTVYYNENTPVDECVELINENIVAYITSDYRFAFVLEEFLNKFISDTAEYALSYLPVKSFSEDEFCISPTDRLPLQFQKIIFINDDFLNDEKIEFDYELFEIIDSGAKYLNPNHFSINDLVSYLLSQDQY